MRNFTIDLIWAKIQIAAAALGGWLGYMLGGKDGLILFMEIYPFIAERRKPIYLDLRLSAAR